MASQQSFLPGFGLEWPECGHESMDIWLRIALVPHSANGSQRIFKFLTSLQTKRTDHRMKKLLFLVCLGPIWLSAQPNAVIDSLQKILSQKKLAQDALGQADALFQISTVYYNQQEDKTAFEYVLAAQQLLPEGNLTLKGRILYRKGMLLNFLGKDQAQCLPILDSAYLLLKPSNDPTILAPFLQSYGPILNQNLEYQKGVNILLEAEQVCLQHP